MPSGPGSASSASASSAQPAAPAAKPMPLFPGATFKARGQARPRSRSRSGPRHRWASPSPPSSYREKIWWSWPTGTHVQCEATLIVLQRAWAQSMVDACVAIDVLAPMCWHVISGACVLGHAVAPCPSTGARNDPVATPPVATPRGESWNDLCQEIALSRPRHALAT